MFEAALEGLGAMRTIRNDCRRGNVAHCYLLCSADRLLLDAFAEETVYAILGGETKNDLLYRKVVDRTHADVLYFPREGKNLNKEEYESMFEELGYAPIDGERRVFVIDRAEKILPNVQNRLLKTLEEPTTGTVFVLKTSATAPLLQTVLSRSRVLEFGGLSFESVRDGLRGCFSGRDITEQDLSWAAEYADGSLTRGAELLERPEYRGMCELVWSFLTQCESSRDLLPWYTKTMGYENQLEDLLRFFADALRDVMAFGTAGESAVVAKDRMTTLRTLSAKISTRAASAGLERIGYALRRLAAYNNRSSVVDELLMGLLEDRAKYPI